MRLGFDIDGVLLRFDEAWVRHCEAKLGRKLVKQSNAYDMGKRYNLTNDQIVSLWEEFEQDGAWQYIASFEDAGNLIEALHQRDHEVVCITAASPKIEAQRRESLRHLGLHNNEIEFVGHHLSGTTKHDAMRRLKPDLYIDDQIYNLVHAHESGIAHRVWVDRGDEQIKINLHWREVAQHRLDDDTGLMPLLDIVDELVSQPRFRAAKMAV